MEREIKQTSQRIIWSYRLFWLLPIMIIIAGESEWIPVGQYADDVTVSYVLETLGILFTAICVPLALKLFSRIFRKKIDEVAIDVALKRYAFWSLIRLALLGVPLLMNLVSYYLTLSRTGLLCMLITLTASLFCVPSEKKLRAELNIYKDESFKIKDEIKD